MEVVAETQLATLVLPEAPLRTALQMDDALHINLGYANALRRTFCLLHTALCLAGVLVLLLQLREERLLAPHIGR